MNKAAPRSGVGLNELLGITLRTKDRLFDGLTDHVNEDRADTADCLCPGLLCDALEATLRNRRFWSFSHQVRKAVFKLLLLVSGESVKVVYQVRRSCEASSCPRESSAALKAIGWLVVVEESDDAGDVVVAADSRVARLAVGDGLSTAA